jgi:hypothetical protein
LSEARRYAEMNFDNLLEQAYARYAVPHVRR